MYFVYVLRCAGSSLYCGYTNDVAHRVGAHAGIYPNGAKYTRSHPPVRVELVYETGTKEDAMKLEAKIKKLTKEKKERLVRGDAITNVIPDLPDPSVYKARPDLTGDVRGDKQ